MCKAGQAAHLLLSASAQPVDMEAAQRQEIGEATVEAEAAVTTAATAALTEAMEKKAFPLVELGKVQPPENSEKTTANFTQEAVVLPECLLASAVLAVVATAQILTHTRLILANREQTTQAAAVVVMLGRFWKAVLAAAVSL
jgi:hypothetical protein